MKQLQLRYIHLWTKTKQVFIFKISHIIYTSSANVLIGFLANLSTVALYGNYNMLMSKVTSAFDGIFTGMGASIGNLIAEGNKEKILRNFYELLSIRYFIASFCSISFYFVSSPFILIWLGDTFLMSNNIILLLTIQGFILQARLTVINFKDAYGLFQDVWAPISEVVMYITISLILGKFWGLSGILMGVIISQTLIKMIWQPYYLFKHGFKQSVLKMYWPIFLKYLCIIGISIIAISQISKVYLSINAIDGWLSMVVYCLVIGVDVFLILTILFFVTDKYFRSFINHIYNYLKNR